MSERRTTEFPVERPLRVAVIGAGRIAENHLRFLQRSPRAQLVGVADLSPALADWAARRFDVETVFIDVPEMLGTVVPDVVHVLTPAETHFRFSLMALQAGAHVVVEKPVAATNAEFRSMWAIAERERHVLTEDHNYRFNWPIRELQQRVKSGTLGELRELSIRIDSPVLLTAGRYSDQNLTSPSHSLPGGFTHEYLPHLAYLAGLFMPEITGVDATWAKRVAGHGSPADDLTARLEGGGMIGTLRFSAVTWPNSILLRLGGSDGWADAEIALPTVRVNAKGVLGPQLSPIANQFRNGAGSMSTAIRGLKDKLLQKANFEGLHIFLDETYAALQAGLPPPIGFDAMDRASHLIDRLVAGLSVS